MLLQQNIFLMNACHNLPQKMIDSDAITSPYLLAKPLLRWLHRRTSHPQRCDIAGSAMPREHALFIVVKVQFKFNIPPGENRKKKITIQIHAVSTIFSMKSVDTVETDQSRDHSEFVLCEWPALNLG
jgi:hypothetical protein